MKPFFEVAKKEPAKTIRLVNIEDGQILLVHEKDDEFTEKPAGWGLPGGKLDSKATVEELLASIGRFLPVYGRVPLDQVESMLEKILDFVTDMDLRVFLVGVKEGVEETGLVIRPEKELFSRKNAPDHESVVLDSRVLGGQLSTHSVETDDCRRFPLEALPLGIYHSHFRMIQRAVQEMGLQNQVQTISPEPELQEEKEEEKK